MAELSEAESVRRLVDRFGFGAGGDALTRWQDMGHAAVVDTLLAPTGPDTGATATPVPELPSPQRPERAAEKPAERATRPRRTGRRGRRTGSSSRPSSSPRRAGGSTGWCGPSTRPGS